MQHNYKQNGFNVTLNTEKVTSGKNRFITILTLLIKKKDSVSKYVIVDTDGKNPSYSTFRKLITEPKYRKNFLVEGYEHCTEKFAYTNPKGVNYDCTHTINAFKKKVKKSGYKPSIQDYKDIKSYGQDAFSGLDIHALEDAIKDKRYLDKVREVFQSEEHQASVYRWYLRGLPQVHAIQKELIRILTDNDFRENFLKKHLNDSLKEELVARTTK